MSARNARRCLGILGICMASAALAAPHSADYEAPEGIIDLSELLRVIQFYNVGTFHCAAGTEDGYAPGTGDQACTPHKSDYAPQDWSIRLSELLRMIQFFNSDGYHLEPGTEDGYAPGPGGLYEGEGIEEGSLPEGLPEEGEGFSEGVPEGAEEGESVEGMPEEGQSEGLPEGTLEGGVEGLSEGEGTLEGSLEGTFEGVVEGILEGAEEGGLEGEGIAEGTSEGISEGEGLAEGSLEGAVEGSLEGIAEGSPEGAREGEGMMEGAPEGTMEGAAEGEGAVEGSPEGEGEGEEPVYAIGYTTITYQDTARGNREVPVKIYYPAAAAGQDTPVAGDAGRKFPVVIFGHGFVIGIEYYGYLWDALVPKGYIAVLSNTETSVLPSHENLGKDLAFLADRFQAEGGDTGSRFYGKVASKTAVLGHSMGGGATFLSVQYSANITTIVTFAAAETNPSAIAAAAAITIPSLVFSGSSDCVAPPNSHQIPMHNALPSLCKYLISITEGSHCQFAQSSTLCNAAQSVACPFRSYVSETVQKALTLEFMLPWLSAFLKNEIAAGAEFITQLDAETAAGKITFTGACS